MSIELDELSGLMGIGPELVHVAELLEQHRPAWMADALCKEHPDVSFFPDVGKPTAPAKSVCSSCLVRCECLAYALEFACVGIWGGTSDRQRARALRQGIGAATLIAMLTASATTCSECSKGGRLRRGLCDACYQRARSRKRSSEGSAMSVPSCLAL